jgi:hypothetical protein
MAGYKWGTGHLTGVDGRKLRRTHTFDNAKRIAMRPEDLSPEALDALRRGDTKLFKQIAGTAKKRRFGKYLHKPHKPNVSALYPSDCYQATILGQSPNGGPQKPKTYLQNECYDDVVARIENALLCGMVIPPHFSDQDLYACHVPSRRVVAFAFATLLPNVGDNFRSACKVARIPLFEVTNRIYPSPENMYFLTQFWRERISARSSGTVFLYADRYASSGSSQHLRLLAEMSGIIQSNATQKHEHRHSIDMPTDPAQTAIDVTPKPAELTAGSPQPASGGYDELTEEPR